MSFDIFVSCLNNGGAKTFKRQVAQDILGREALKPDKVLLGNVDYPDGSGSSVHCSDGEELASIMFNHSGGETFFERLWELADRTGSMIFWPGYETPVAVTRPEMLQYIPRDDEGKQMEPRFLVRDARELADWIQRTS